MCLLSVARLYFFSELFCFLRVETGAGIFGFSFLD